MVGLLKAMCLVLRPGKIFIVTREILKHAIYGQANVGVKKL